MVWFDIILGKRRVTPQEISKCFKVFALIPLFAFFFHFVDVYPEGGLNGTGWRWKGTIKFSRYDPNALFDAKYQFPNTVEVAPQTANVIFSFPSFKEWFNIYTGSFFFLDTLKWRNFLFLSKLASFYSASPPFSNMVNNSRKKPN